jgi:hypothetical protein
MVKTGQHPELGHHAWKPRGAPEVESLLPVQAPLPNREKTLPIGLAASARCTRWGRFFWANEGSPGAVGAYGLIQKGWPR